jgi:hypothetical protein
MLRLRGGTPLTAGAQSDRFVDLGGGRQRCSLDLPSVMSLTTALSVPLSPGETPGLDPAEAPALPPRGWPVDLPL